MLSVRSLIAGLYKVVKRCCRDGNPVRAHTILSGLVEFTPRNVLVRIWLAEVALEIGDHESFASALAAERIDPLLQRPSHFCWVARLHLLEENIPLALQYAEIGSRRFPTCPSLWELRGQASIKCGDLAGAAVCYDMQYDASATLRQRIVALENIVKLGDVTGNREIIFPAVERMLSLKLDHGWARFRLVDADRTLCAASSIAEDLRTTLMKPSLAPIDKCLSHYAMGTVLHRSGRFDEAFAHFFLGNELRLNRFPGFDLAAVLAQMRARRDVYTPQLIERLAQYGDLDAFWICVVGMPRSGTTLVERILCCHPGIQGLGERADIGIEARQMRHRMRSALPYPDCAAQLTGQMVTQVARRVRRRLLRHANGAQRVVTKLPADYLELGLIRILFPNVRIIHCCRQAADTCLSNYMQAFEWIQESADLPALGFVYKEYEVLMRHWKAVLGEDTIHDVHYEELVAQPETVIRSMCDYCDIEFDDSCLNFHNTKTQVNTCSSWQVRQPLYSSSVGQSRHYREFLDSLGISVPC